MERQRVRQWIKLLALAFGPVAALATLSFAMYVLGYYSPSNVKNAPPQVLPISEWSRVDTLSTVGTYGDSSSLSGAVDIASLGKYLVAVNPDTKKAAIAIDYTSDTEYDLIQLLGEDKGHMLRHSFVWRGIDNRLYFGSSSSKYFTCLDIDMRDDKRILSAHEMVRSANLRSSYGLTKGVWISNGYFDDALISVNRLNGRDLVEVNRHGHALYPDVSSAAIRAYTNMNTIVAHPSGDAIAQGFRYSARIHIYDGDGHLRRTLSSPIDVRLSYDERAPSNSEHAQFGIRSDTKDCYVDIAATDKYIVALFSGRALTKYPIIGGTQIHIFAWDGTFVGVWRLDCLVARIDASDDGQYLWGFRPVPTPHLVAFRLPV